MPLPLIVNEPPMVVLAFFRMVKALLLAEAVPFPMLNRRSVAIGEIVPLISGV